jgi:hypothetical protein
VHSLCHFAAPLFSSSLELECALLSFGHMLVGPFACGLDISRGRYVVYSNDVASRVGRRSGFMREEGEWVARDLFPFIPFALKELVPIPLQAHAN